VLPVRIIKGELSAEEQRKRLYLGNLSRFEIDEDTRLTLYAKVWPGYFLDAKTGRPEKGDTVSPFSTKAEIAAATGKSERQVQRDRAVVLTARKIALGSGKAEADTEDIRRAREKENAQRRTKGKYPTKPPHAQGHGVV